MNPEELARLVDAVRDGTIALEDAERLAAALRAGGEEARRIAREFQFEGIVSQALEKPDDEVFVRSFKERVAAEGEESAFLRAFEARRRTVRKASPSRSWALPLTFAAGVLFAILLYLLSISGPAPAPAPKPVATAPAPPSEELPAPRETPPAPREEPRAPELPIPKRAEDRPRVTPPPPAPLAPAPGPAPTVPAPAPKAPDPAPVKETRVAFATLQSASGEVIRLDGAARNPFSDGQGLEAGQGIETGAKSLAALVFADGTRFELGPDTVLREISDRKGKRIVMARGVVTAQVARQPADSPLLFATPHGEARVLGTVLRLEVDAQTRLEVSEGKVRLTRAGGKSADVPAGSVAWCAPGVEPAPRLAHPEDIVLLPRDAKFVGDEWRIAADRNASTGAALEVAKAPFKPIDHVEKRPAYALFTFWAPADVEYRLWLRSTSLATGDKWLREMVTLEPQNCAMSARSPFFGSAPTNAFVFTGLASWSGYAWSSGPFDESKPEAAPLTLKFKSTGLQTLRVYTVHPSIRIDSIWLSARQATRPAPRALPPQDNR